MFVMRDARRQTRVFYARAARRSLTLCDASGKIRDRPEKYIFSFVEASNERQRKVKLLDSFTLHIVRSTAETSERVRKTYAPFVVARDARALKARPEKLISPTVARRGTSPGATAAKG